MFKTVKIKNITNKLFRKEFYNTRTGKIIANLSSTMLLKYISMLISFFMVPITLEYLDKTRYGLWAALHSVLAWFFIFDIGIGNGLRNKFTELKAKNRMDELKSYVSTSYFIFGILATIIIIAFVIINQFIDWSKLLNAPLSMHRELSVTVEVVFIVMCGSFVLKLINTILAADLKNAASNLISVIAHVISLIGIIFLTKFTSPSILKYALLYTSSNVLVTFIASIILFSGLYKSVSPNFRFIDMSLWYELVSVGSKFFFITIAMNLMTHTTGLIISNLLGPEYVTDYTINMRYFALSAMGFGMMVQPLWSGYGDAYHRHDFSWIKKTFLRLNKIWFLLVGVLIMMIGFQKFAFHLWLKDKLQVDYILSVLFGIYYGFHMLNAIYNPFINSTSKIRLQMILYISLSMVYLVVAVMFLKVFHLGIRGIVLALILFHTMPLSILTMIQSKKILAGAKGIWDK